ncbi:hypothetical protein AV942_13005 [Alteromonas mediterranea]|uniref:Uncharacterized protein n=1 Tax=Alteromonas mediterranea TaxID=314275 RepID=A0AAC8XKF2_9ALTE|nr:hypothetical protein AV942_13005 [Alteromonas mediterranea]
MNPPNGGFLLSAPEKNNGVKVLYSLNIRTGYTFIASAVKSEKCTLTPLLTVCSTYGLLK